MAEQLIHIFMAFLDLIFPKKCLGCGSRGAFLCNNCLNSLPECYETGFNGPEIFAAVLYENDVVKNAIRRLKYHGVKSLAEPLAELIFRRLARDRSSFFTKDGLSQTLQILIIPIPLSRKKFRQRGYNQSELLGKFLLDRLRTPNFGQKNIGCRTDVLYKIKETISQVEIKDRSKRLKNLKGAFGIKNPEAIKNKNVILVDDIVTTGATMGEASRVLKNAGARKIIGLVVAKG